MSTENGWTNPYENQTCAECNYGAIDNQGLCVMDATHVAVLFLDGVPQVDGYYWYHDLVREEIVERFKGSFYTERSRYALTGDDVRRSGKFLGPLKISDFEQLAALRKAAANAIQLIELGQHKTAVAALSEALK